MTETAAHKTSSLPSLHELFSDSWTTFKESALQVFIIYVIGFVAILALILVVALVILISGLSTGFLTYFQKSDPHLGAFLPLIIGGVIFGVLLFLGLVVIGSFMQTGTIIAMSTYQKRLSLKEIFKKSVRLIIPMVVASLFISFFVIGGFFVLIIPAIVFSLLFSFVTYEIVIENKRGLAALRRSVYIFKSNFWGIFGRILLFTAISIIASYLALLFQLDGSAQTFSSAFSMLINVVMSWFGIAYGITLYKQAKKSADPSKTSSLLPFLIISAIGWVIFGFILFGIYSVLSSGAFKNSLKSYTTNQATSQKVKDLNPQAQIHYENSLALFDEIQGLAAGTDGTNRSQELLAKIDENVAEIKLGIEADPENPILWNLLGNAYSWTRDTKSLEEGIAAYQMAQSLDPTAAIYLQGEANILIRLEKYDDAILKLNQATRLPETPEVGYVYDTLGVSYQRAGLYDQARKSYQVAIQKFTQYNTNGVYDQEILRTQKDQATLPQ